ncbi:hypothetical protein DSO57_1030961 [Entomophthora muscae]|uniref:Uncharacterized protein n=1 Tax=Entomophthora muscae TaxID=34485 RepID=A0ACC2UMG5_9FUNG|nr:hypothetical protein DSO57_1030961 [Entomophthora muscae]
MSPDVSEYWNGHFTTLAFEITQEQFSLMKQKIEEDKHQQLYPYQVYQSNCTIWAKSICEVAGLNLPSSLAAADLLTPGLAAFARKINGLGFTPEWVKNIVKLVFAVSHNCLGLILGSGMVHPNFKSDPDLNSSVPYIHSLRDLFDIKKAISEHPFVLGNYVRNQVEEWRSSKKQELMATKEELISKLSSADAGDKEPLQAQLDEVNHSLDSIQYAVPPEFKS